MWCTLSCLVLSCLASSCLVLSFLVSCLAPGRYACGNLGFGHVRMRNATVHYWQIVIMTRVCFTCVLDAQQDAASGRWRPEQQAGSSHAAQSTSSTSGGADWSSLLPPDVHRRNTRGQPLLYSTKPAAFGEETKHAVVSFHLFRLKETHLKEMPYGGQRTTCHT
eukprot:COSAG06_NODE_1365_length_9687_cov_14.601064_8_plen_164_part_00